MQGARPGIGFVPGGGAGRGMGTAGGMRNAGGMQNTAGMASGRGPPGLMQNRSVWSICGLVWDNCASEDT
eukprot:1378534-Amorphochlora_amoeboformis.AAC.1